MYPKSFIIVGGGTAGWMTALLLEKSFPDVKIQLLESSGVSTIGVGEGSTPAFKSLMDAIEIKESEWMPYCDATFKSGISFCNWSQREGFNEYFHPFFSHFDRDHIKALIFNAHLRRAGRDVYAHPNAFCYSHYLAERDLCPIAPYSFPFETQHGYHFNAGKLAELLKETAIKRGIVCHSAHISNVVLDDFGDVAKLVTNDNVIYEADFFFDCSGFSSIIAEKALSTPYLPYSNALLNDRAVTISTAPQMTKTTQTVSTALNCGWHWQIPLQSRTGNGYVYSSSHSNESDAEQELRNHLGLSADAEAKHLKMRVGRLATSWNNNTLAVGLSQGFIEPLEATALALVQLTLCKFIHYYKTGGYSHRYCQQANEEIADAFDNVKEYIHSHYLTSDRADTAYWEDSKKTASVASEKLKTVFNTWKKNGNLDAALNETGLSKHYKLNSWVYLFSGMGLFPKSLQLQVASAEDLSKVPVETIKDFFNRCALNHIPQRDVLAIMSKGGSAFDNEKQSPVDSKEALKCLTQLSFGVSG